LFLGAVEITIANMYKKERSCTEEVYVVGFIPSHLLPKKRPSSLDPFLHPLVSDVEDIFINGKFRAQLSINVSVLQATTESLKTEFMRIEMISAFPPHFLELLFGAFKNICCMAHTKE